MQRWLQISLLGLACGGTVQAQVDRILGELRNPNLPGVLVTAHRSDWRNAPENSLSAMRRAIALGVDIIEVDVRRTKDGHWVIIHDDTLDRTTTGKGPVANLTRAEIGRLRLLAATGHPTEEKIPTLEEALEVARGKVVINLDKSYNDPEGVLKVVQACHALDYALFSVNERLQVMRQLHPGFLERVMYMIVVPLWRPDARQLIEEYLQQAKPTVVQVTFDAAHLSVLNDVRRLPTHHARLWINSIWPEQNAGHDDERAVNDPAGAYGWLVAQNVGIIQTDRPQYLLDYLRSRRERP